MWVQLLEAVFVLWGLGELQGLVRGDAELRSGDLELGGAAAHRDKDVADLVPLAINLIGGKGKTGVHSSQGMRLVK